MHYLALQGHLISMGLTSSFSGWQNVVVHGSVKNLIGKNSGISKK